MPTFAPLPLPDRRARRPTIICAAISLALALALGGCDESDATDPSAPPATAGLVVLAGDPGAAALTVHDARGQGRAVELPTPSVAWVSAARRGHLVATLDDGTLRLSDRLRTGAAPSWSRIPSRDVELPDEPLYFATWSPNGLRLVALAAALPGASRLTLAIVDAVGEASLLLPVPAAPLVAPPAWADDDRILVQTAAGLAVVDTGTGDVRAGPPIDLGAGIPLATSADGSSVALSPEGGVVEIRDLAGWLAGDSGDPAARVEVDGEVGGLAFDRRADRLVVVWQGPDGPGRLTILQRGDDWRAVHDQALPGDSTRAVVDWLP